MVGVGNNLEKIRPVWKVGNNFGIISSKTLWNNFKILCKYEGINFESLWLMVMSLLINEKKTFGKIR